MSDLKEILRLLPKLRGGRELTVNYDKEEDWDLFDIEERIRADEWDGHTPEDVAQRIEKYLRRQ